MARSFLFHCNAFVDFEQIHRIAPVFWNETLLNWKGGGGGGGGGVKTATSFIFSKISPEI